jgi:hypothetical protein
MLKHKLEDYSGSRYGYNDEVKDCGCIMHIEDCDHMKTASGYKPKEEIFVCPRHYERVGKLQYLLNQSEEMHEVLKLNMAEQIQRIRNGLDVFLGRPFSDIAVDLTHVTIDKDKQTPSTLDPFEGAVFHRLSPGILSSYESSRKELRDEYMGNNATAILVDLSTGVTTIDDDQRRNEILDKICRTVEPGLIGQATYNACDKGLWSLAQGLYSRRTDEVRAELDKNIPGMHAHITKMISTKEYTSFWP